MLAALVGAWLVLGGVLGMRHEARVRHVLDVRTGAVRHADAIAATATVGAAPSCRAAGAAPDGDLCAIATVLHQGGQPGPARVSLGRPALSCTVATSLPSIPARPLAAVYAFAPKTSPPLRA